MRHLNPGTDKGKILKSVYGSSMSVSMTAMVVIEILELFMLVYTVANPAFYGPYVQRYRGFYIALLTVAAAYFGLCVYVKWDVGGRYRLLNAAYRRSEKALRRASSALTTARS